MTIFQSHLTLYITYAVETTLLNNQERMSKKNKCYPESRTIFAVYVDEASSNPSRKVDIARVSLLDVCFP
jgi:hypothetical protein